MSDDLPPDSELQPGLQKIAQENVASFAKHFNLSLDYSEASLQTIDEAISMYHADGACMESTYWPYLAYVGEVTRRNLGGHWTMSDDQGPALHLLNGERSATAFPHTWVVKRFTEGRDEALALKYSAMKSLLGLPGELSLTPPFPEEGYPQMPDPSETGLQPEQHDLLAKGSVFVFLLIAAADGSIDGKEVKMFQKVVNEIHSSSSPLFKAAIMTMLPDIDRHLDECSGSVMSIASRLGDLRQLVETMYPDMAEGYFRALYGMGERVAKASGGGFMGLGKKIGKQEEASLGLLRMMLGIPA